MPEQVREAGAPGKTTGIEQRAEVRRNSPVGPVPLAFRNPDLL